MCSGRFAIADSDSERVSFREGTEETLAIRMSRSHLLLLATVRLLGHTLIRRGLMLVQLVMVHPKAEKHHGCHHTVPLLPTPDDHGNRIPSAATVIERTD